MNAIKTSTGREAMKTLSLSICLVLAGASLANADRRTNAFSSPDSPSRQSFSCSDGAYGTIYGRGIMGTGIEMNYKDLMAGNLPADKSVVEPD